MPWQGPPGRIPNWDPKSPVHRRQGGTLTEGPRDQGPLPRMAQEAILARREMSCPNAGRPDKELYHDRHLSQDVDALAGTARAGPELEPQTLRAQEARGDPYGDAPGTKGGPSATRECPAREGWPFRHAGMPRTST